ncbi:MAG: hypothetical protein J07HR59_01557 [Halorubrum sp. J07HR59]|nr:MAG: hypothetical protein J07HR59_01557 [Halorubrum sp. J07HR59]
MSETDPDPDVEDEPTLIPMLRLTRQMTSLAPAHCCSVSTIPTS